MNVNIYTKNNGVGLEADAKIIKEALDCPVNIFDWEQRYNRYVNKYATLGIHLEHIRKEFLLECPLNILIPNPEWFDQRFVRHLKKIDVVLCKSQDGINVFSPLHPDCRFIGFTSPDRFKPVEKLKEFIHMAGKSMHKNTDVVFDAFTKKRFPLTIQKLEKSSRYNCEKPGYRFIGKRIDDIDTFLSSFQFHLCPSKSEGFGHYINEALSVGGIVITTDAPPMNELVTPEYGILVKATKTGHYNLGSEYTVNPDDLNDAIERCLNLTDPEIEIMSRKAREAYLIRDKEFKTNINNFMRCVIL